MKKLLLKSILLLCALVVGTSAWAVDYELYSGTITEGDYVIYYNGKALKNTITSSRFDYLSPTPSEDKITNPAATIVWHIAKDGDYWTIYNAAVNKYAGGTTTKNQGALLASVTDYARWTVTGTETYDFENKGRAGGSSDKDKKWLRNNGTYGWACYSTSTGGALSLYKKIEAAGAATTVTINSTGITNTNKFVSTEAGTLTATVTYGSPAAAVPGAAVTWSSSNTSVATVDESTGIVTLVGEGATTITASYAGKSGEYKSSYAEYVLNVTDEDPNMITLWSEDFSGFNDNDVPSGGTYGYVCVDGNSDTKIYAANMAGGTSPELLVNKNGGTFSATIPLENITGNLKLRFKSNAYAVTVSTSTDGISILGDASFNAAGEHTVTFTGVTTSMTSVTITFAAGSSSNVRIDDIVLKGSKIVPVTVTAAGLATFASDYKLDFTNVPDLEAYIAKEAAGVITLEQVNKVAAGTGVLLRALNSATDFVVPVITADADDATGNKFVRGNNAAVATSEGGNYNWILSKKGEVIGFYHANGNTVASNRAYLQTTTASARILLDFDDVDVTAIENVEVQKADSQYFNLAGQRVANPTKGLYIVNGKKVVIK